MTFIYLHGLYVTLYANYVSLLFVFLFSLNLVQLLGHTSFRYRIISFYVFLLFCSVWGFYYSFEGFIFLLLLSELLIIMIFTVIYFVLQFTVIRFSGLTKLI